MPRALSPIALLVVLFLLTPPSVRAEDAPRSAEQLIATLPAPSAQQAFRFEGSMRIKGAVFMNLELSVTPAAGGLWQLRERRIGTPDSRGREDIEEAVVDARLGLRQGVVRRLGPLPQSGTAGVLRELRWGVSQGNLVVQDRRGQRAPALAVRTPAFTTIAQTAYLLRHIASDRKVRYRVDYLKVRDPAQGGARLEPALLASHGRVQWNGRTVWMTSAKRPDRGIEIAFDPATRKVLGMRLMTRGDEANSVEVLPGKTDFRKKGVTLPAAWQGPARTPRDAAARLVYALAARDIPTFDRSVHWATLARSQPGATDVAAFRQDILARMQKLPQHANPAEVLRSIQTTFQSARVTAQGNDRALIEANRPGGTVARVQVARIDGAWIGVAMPVFTRAAGGPR